MATPAILRISCSLDRACIKRPGSEKERGLRNAAARLRDRASLALAESAQHWRAQKMAERTCRVRGPQ